MESKSTQTISQVSSKAIQKNAKLIKFPEVQPVQRRQSLWPCVTVDLCAFRKQKMQQKRHADNRIMGEMYRQMCELEETRKALKNSITDILDGRSVRMSN